MSAIDNFINKNEKRVYEWFDTIEEMLGSGKYTYAEDTLISILDFIDARGIITDGQIQAVENIKSKPQKRYGRRY